MNNLLLESLYFIRTHRANLFRLLGPFFIVMAVIAAYVSTAASENDAAFGLYLAIYSVGQAYYMCRLIKYMAAVVTSNQPDVAVSFSEWGRLFLVLVIYGVVVVIGIMALILPGIYLSARYGFAEFEAVLNKRSPIAAMGSSWNQTKPYVMPLIMGLLLISGGGLLVDLLLTSGEETRFSLLYGRYFLAEIISSFVLVLMSVFYFRVYVSSLDFGGSDTKSDVNQESSS